MLRKRVRDVLIDDRKRSKLARFLTLAAVIGTLWFFSGPYYAEEVFTSENAIKDNYVDSVFQNDPLVRTIFEKVKEDLETINNDSKSESDRIRSVQEYIKQRVSKYGEVYKQKLQKIGYGSKSNTYAYLRSKDGFGNECNIVTAPLDYNPSVAYVLTFYELMARREPDWLSKDILFLFYPETDYSFAVQEFLDAYYSDNISRSAARRIEGRCGYLRQGFPLVIKEFDFTKVSLMYDGLNSQLSDIDFYNTVRNAVKFTSGVLNYDVTLPAYFRSNPFINQAQSFLAPITKSYFAALQEIL